MFCTLGYGAHDLFSKYLGGIIICLGCLLSISRLVKYINNLTVKIDMC